MPYKVDYIIEFEYPEFREIRLAINNRSYTIEVYQDSLPFGKQLALELERILNQLEARREYEETYKGISDVSSVRNSSKLP